MDPLTQASLGGAIGAAFFHKTLGRRAVLFGALAGMSPDLDVIAGLWSNEWDTLIAHRGTSHSLVVLPFIAPFVGMLGCRILGGGRNLQSWMHLAFWAMWTHPVLDAFTTYGTQLLAPFSRERFVFDAVAIIDPFFTVPLFAVVLLTYTRWASTARLARWGRWALVWACLYLAVGLGLTRQAEGAARSQLASEGFATVDLRAGTPFFFPAVRRISAYDDQGEFRIGFRSAVAPRPIRWTRLHSVDDERVRKAREQAGVFHWFAADFVQAVHDGQDVVFYDRRYGLVSKPSFTPFRARAVFDGNEPVRVSQAQGFDRSGLSLKGELRHGWHLLWGLP